MQHKLGAEIRTSCLCKRPPGRHRSSMPARPTFSATLISAWCSRHVSSDIQSSCCDGDRPGHVNGQMSQIVVAEIQNPQLIQHSTLRMHRVQDYRHAERGRGCDLRNSAATTKFAGLGIVQTLNRILQGNADLDRIELQCYRDVRKNTQKVKRPGDSQMIIRQSCDN